MKILIVTHDFKHYSEYKRKMRWGWFPYYFDKLGYKVEYITKQRWLYYPLIYLRFRPDIVIGIGKTGALITALHHKLSQKLKIFEGLEISKKFQSRPKAKFVFDLNDHPAFYKNDKRIRFLIRNHDILTTSSYYYSKKYNCEWIINGSNFNPLKDKVEYDIIYIGQTHSIYNIKKIKEECEKNNIKLKIISTVPIGEVPKHIAKSKLCLYSISWDASAKMTDYAAMGKAVVALKPNLAEEIGYPAYYTDNLINGIKLLLKNTKKIKQLESESLVWFKEHSGTWKEQAEKYLEKIR